MAKSISPGPSTIFSSRQRAASLTISSTMRRASSARSSGVPAAFGRRARASGFGAGLAALFRSGRNPRPPCCRAGRPRASAAGSRGTCIQPGKAAASVPATSAATSVADFVGQPQRAHGHAEIAHRLIDLRQPRAPALEKLRGLDHVRQQDAVHHEAGAVFHQHGQLADALHELQRARRDRRARSPARRSPPRAASGARD